MEVMDDLTGRRMEPFFDRELCCVIVKWTDEWVVGVSPMIYNDRIILMRRDCWRMSIEAGWCYDKTPDMQFAIHVALAWDPDTEDTPVGFKKEVSPRDRSNV